MKPEKNYFIFDLYGTLADIHTNENTSYLWKKMTELYSGSGACYETGQLRRRFKELLMEQEQITKDKLGRDTAEPDISIVFENLYLEKNIHPNEQMIQDTALFFRVLSRKYIRNYEHTFPVLTELKKKGKKIFLLSNAQKIFTMAEVKFLQLDEYFETIYLSSERGVKKPDPTFLEEMIKEYKIPLKEAVMIGNDWNADMGIAKAVGMDGIYMNTELSPTWDKKLLKEMRSASNRKDVGEYTGVETETDLFTRERKDIICSPERLLKLIKIF